MISQIDILSKFKNIYLNMSLTQSVYNFTIPLCISKYFYIRLSKLLKCFCYFAVCGNLYDNCNLSDFQNELWNDDKNSSFTNYHDHMLHM